MKVDPHLVKILTKQKQSILVKRAFFGDGVRFGNFLQGLQSPEATANGDDMAGHVGPKAYRGNARPSYCLLE